MSGQAGEWTIEGSRGEAILGNVHRPTGGRPARGVVLLAHGFKGYKDYGMFARIASGLAEAGFIAHRFNFSHSGMTNAIATFERPDLFERDTWNTQVEDIERVIDGAVQGQLDGRALPFVLVGHSRGGVSVLLAAGRAAASARPQPAGVVTVAAPSRCNVLTPGQELLLLAEGFLESPSSRTGQVLRIGRAFLDEMRAEPAAFDLASVARRVACPALVIHGTADGSVPSAAALEIAQAIGPRARVRLIEGADHVFNVPNPLPFDAPSSAQLGELVEALAGFCEEVCA